MNWRGRRRLRRAPEIRVEIRERGTDALVDSFTVRAERLDGQGMIEYIARTTVPLDGEFYVALDELPAQSTLSLRLRQDEP